MTYVYADDFIIEVYTTLEKCSQSYQDGFYVVKVQENHLPLSIKIIPFVLLKCIWFIYITILQNKCKVQGEKTPRTELINYHPINKILYSLPYEFSNGFLI